MGEESEEKKNPTVMALTSRMIILISIQMTTVLIVRRVDQTIPEPIIVDWISQKVYVNAKNLRYSFPYKRQ